MDEEMSVLKALLLWLWKISKPWEYSDSVPRDIYNRIQTTYFSWSNDNEIENMYAFETRILSIDSKRYLYLRPTDSNIVPVLDIAWDQSRSIPELRLRIGLFLLDEKNEVKAFGYRFESPETSGVHHYYHAQYIHGFLKDQILWGQERSWISADCPTFPLDADGPVKLLLSLLIALYGKRFAVQIRAAVPQTEPYINQMHFFKPFPLVWYRKVTLHDLPQSSNVVYYCVEDDEKFHAEMQKTHVGCKIEPISPIEYNNQPKKTKRMWP